MISTRHFREHPIDGAMLYFHPETGTHVRVRTEATRALRRKAPRVVMFGVTNVCNLHCAFCSRDPMRESEWTVVSAAEILEGLARAGTLEVAFGGGEPFAFRGFEELLLRLRSSTALALNVTTNGTLLRADMLARLRGVLGQVRLSIYEEQPWREAARLLASAGQLWGANVLVDDRVSSRLPDLLIELAALGARDVSLLSYVGDDPDRQLSPSGERILAAIVRQSAIPCRVSVCFGARLALPRLFDGMDDGGDCGAGLDFITIAADKRVQSCSFQSESFAIASAEDVLSVWRARRDALRAASPRLGCARIEPRAPPLRRDGVRLWQAFSGNNSGECVLVARFEKAEDADRLLAELIPGYEPGKAYGAPWKELFVRERVTGSEMSYAIAPDEMLTIGRAFIARTDMAPGDDFPELRALAWKRGGEVLPGGIHVHDDSVALLAIRARDEKDRTALTERARSEGAVALPYGGYVIASLPRKARDPKKPRAPDAPLAWMSETTRAIASGRPFSLEMFFHAVGEQALTLALKELGGSAPSVARLAVYFSGLDLDKESGAAARFASELDGAVTRSRNLVLVEELSRKKRLAVLAHRRGATVASLEGEAVAVHARFGRDPIPRTKGRRAPSPDPVDPIALERDLRDRLRHALGPAPFEITNCAVIEWSKAVSVSVLTPAPALAMIALDAHARDERMTLWTSISDVRRLERAIRRLLRDLGASLPSR